MSRLIVLVFSALLAGATLFGNPSAAGAVDNPDYTAPPPSVAIQNRTPTVRTASTTSTASKPSAPTRTRLAITGAETTQLVYFGTLLVASGAMTLALRRRLT